MFDGLKAARFRPHTPKAVLSLFVVFLSVVAAVGEYLHWQFMKAPTTMPQLWRYAQLSLGCLLLCGGISLLRPDFRHLVARRLEALSRLGMGLLVLAESTIVAAAIVVLSNRQFAGFDQSILVDTMWRQVIGQVPFMDFPTTAPPLWILGAGAAGRLFGATWNAQAYFLGCFAIVLGAWGYWLCRRLQLGRAASLAVVVCCQIPACLLPAFWWFNGVTAVVAAIFALATVAMLQTNFDVPTQASFVALFSLLLMTKADTAGVLSVGSLCILLIVSERRWRVLLLAAGALCLTCLLLVGCSISPGAILRSYGEVAQSRGLQFRGLSINLYFNLEVLVYLTCMAGAVLAAGARGYRAARDGDRSRLAMHAILLLTIGVGVLAALSNGDVPSTALTPAFVALCVIVADRRSSPVFRSFYWGLVAAMLCSATASAIGRVRVEISGPYFSLDRVRMANVPYFADLRTSMRMREVGKDVAKVLPGCKGAIFFADRLEWAYAGFKVASPMHLPVFWETGVSYGPKQEAAMIQRWRDARFPTVIQPRDALFGYPDWTVSPSDFRDALHRDYQADETHPWIIVWQHK